MKVFITGICGFLGQHLRSALIAASHTVTGCDITDDDVPFDFIHGDCRNRDRMNRWLNGVDVVVHTAAFPHEGLSSFSPLVISDSIYRGSVATFSAAISSGVRRIVMCSSMSRYGAISSPFREIDTPSPVDPYGIAKLAAEKTLEALAKVHSIEYVIAVPHNLYGPWQCRSDPYRNVLAIWMNRILQGKAPIIYGDGKQRRCFTYIDDVIPCFMNMAIGDDSAMLGRVINIGPDHGDVNILQACHMVSDAMGYKGKPIHYAERPAEVEIANCSADLAREIFGFMATTSLHRGIGMMAEWMKEVGPRPFNYFLPIEIINEKTPLTWLRREM